MKNKDLAAFRIRIISAEGLPPAARVRVRWQVKSKGKGIKKWLYCWHQTRGVCHSAISDRLGVAWWECTPRLSFEEYLRHTSSKTDYEPLPLDLRVELEHGPLFLRLRGQLLAKVKTILKILPKKNRER